MNAPAEKVEASHAARRPLIFGALGGVGLAAVVCGAAAICGRTVLEKAVVQLLMPLGIIWLLLTCSVAASVSERRRSLLILSLSGWLLCFVAGNGSLATIMIRSLEKGYYGAQPLGIDRLDAVVVLGGGVGEAPGNVAQVNANGDRLVLAARLYHRGRAGRIICTGKRIAEISVLSRDEASLSEEILIDLGVPKERITLVGGRNTSEEMAQLARLNTMGNRVGLVTSAWHMDRAVRLANANGLEVVPLPADFHSGPSAADRPIGSWILSCVPESGAMHTNGRVIREYLAGLVGR